MRELVVADASTIVAALCATGDDGSWSAMQLRDGDVAAPSLLHFEAANVIRRLAAIQKLEQSEASLAYRDLQDMRVQVWPYEALSTRIWELRGSINCYDAAYVALAEILDAPLLTLDRRLARAPGGRCAVRTPPG
jgi:predicted nucleic acid-binding protein